MKSIAVLITCHNRLEKTTTCLKSLYTCLLPENYVFDIFLVDDGSTDGTSEAIKKEFKEVNIIQGNGNLFWAGGMRLAWQTAIKKQKFDAFLLLNDDVLLNKDFLSKFIETELFSLQNSNKKGIYAGSTIDNLGEISYGGYILKTNHFMVHYEKLLPSIVPQSCHLTNANILWVSNEVLEKIGIFDTRFTHAIADYDYSLRAVKNGIPVYITPGICGYCADDHGNNWKTTDISLKKRIEYLNSPTGLAYKEYMFYIRRHFPLNYPYSFVMIWLKTFFPQLWAKTKKIAS